MGKVTLEITKGGLQRTSTNTDKYIGMILEVTALPSGWTNNTVNQLAKVEDLEALNVLETGTTSDKLIYYHVSEFFRLAPGSLLFVALTTDAFDVDKIDLITNTNNNVRLIGYNSAITILGTTQIEALQTKLDGLYTNEALSIRCVFSATDESINPSTATGGAERVLYDVIQDITTGSLAKDVYDNNSSRCNATGTLLGLFSNRPVHQKVSWVETGDISGNDWSDFALIDGTSIKNWTQAQIEAEEAKGINVPRTYPRSTGTFISDTRSSTTAEDDFALLSVGRVVDKVATLVYDALLPSVDRPAYVDPSTGYLTEDAVEFIRSTAYDVIQTNMVEGKSGNDIEVSVNPNTGRLADDSVFVDPNQNVLSTETIEVIVGIVPVGSSKIINVKIGVRNPAAA